MKNPLSSGMYLKPGEREELARFAAAGARIVEQARRDMNFAHQLLKDIGFFAFEDNAEASAESTLPVS